MEDRNKNKGGILLLGLVRVSDRAVLASFAADTRGFTGAALKELLAARSTPPEPERKVTAEGEAHAMHYVADGNKGVMYAVVTAPAYHSRVAFACLDELRQGVDARFDREALLQAKENGALKTALKPLLKELISRFEDPAQADRVLRVQAKVDVVREAMQDSLQVLLQNDAKLQNLEKASEALTEQAKVFQAKTTRLRRNMQWEEWRWRIMVALLICVVLLVVVTPIVFAAQRKNKGALEGALEAGQGQEKEAV